MNPLFVIYIYTILHINIALIQLCLMLSDKHSYIVGEFVIIHLIIVLLLQCKTKTLSQAHCYQEPLNILNILFALFALKLMENDLLIGIYVELGYNLIYAIFRIYVEYKIPSDIYINLNNYHLLISEKDTVNDTEHDAEHDAQHV